MVIAGKHAEYGEDDAEIIIEKPSEWEQVERLAKELGIKPSEYIRRKVLVGSSERDELQNS